MTPESLSSASLVLLVGAAGRIIAAAAHAAPTVLCGLVVAAVVRQLFGPKLTRQLLAAGSANSLMRAWLLGMLLPVCSIGAIPVARELRRAGLAGGTVLAFAVSAPLFNPISLLYGLTLSHPLVIIGFALASMIVVTFVGTAWDRLLGGSTPAVEPAPEPAVPPGWRRVAAMTAGLAREAAGPSLGYAFLALLGVGLLACVLPFGSLQRSMKAFDPWAPSLMAAVGLPAFLTPTDAMMQVGSMFDHGNSVGAAYVLLSAGAGLNLGLVAWAWRTWGLRAAAGWLAIFFATVLAIAAAIERPLSFRDAPPEDHTHAFDVFCMPFPTTEPNPGSRVAALLADRVPQHEWMALGFLGVIIAAGMAIRRLDPGEAFEARLVRGSMSAGLSPGSSGGPGRFDVAVPSPVLGGVLVSGLVAASVAAAYLYYPDLPICLKDLSFVEAETHAAALDGDKRRTQVWIAAWEDLVRRTEVGLWIRRGTVTRAMTEAAEALRERIEALEHAVLDPETIDREAVAAELKQVLAAGRAHRDALRGQPSDDTAP